MITTKLEYINERLDEMDRRMFAMKHMLDDIKLERATEQGGKKAMVALGALIGAVIGAGSAILTALASVGWLK